MVRIISDTSTLYSPELTEGLNLDVSPLIVTINGKSYKELVDINTKEFIDIINVGHVPVSSQPSIGDVVEAYKKYPDDEIINISMAKGLSGTYESALTAKSMVDNKDAIDVINTRTLCGPHRYLVDLAMKLAELGKSKNEIIKEIETLMDTAKSFLMPADFKYLVRGGRLSSLAGAIGDLIKFTPILTQTEDGTRLKKYATKRTFKSAVSCICEFFEKHGINEKYKFYVSHACDEANAIFAKNFIEKNIENADVEIVLLTPAFTTQGGPKCIAIQYVKKFEFKTV